MTPKVKESYKYFADKDLFTAQALYEVRGCENAVVVNLQQAIEKLLKHRLQQAKISFSNTHALKTLFSLAYPEYLQNYKPILLELTDFYFTGRYPSEGYVEITHEDLIRIWEMSTNLYKFIEETPITQKPEELTHVFY